jgi:hypothetical protein
LVEAAVTGRGAAASMVRSAGLTKEEKSMAGGGGGGGWGVDGSGRAYAAQRWGA